MPTSVKLIRSSRDSDESGSVLVIVLTVTAIIAVLAVAYAESLVSAQQTRAKLAFLNLTAELQTRIRNTANDANSWTVTISDLTNNSSMACISTDSCTSPVGPTPFVLWPAGVTASHQKMLAVYDSTNPASGFTLSGKSCSSFNENGSSDCPVHVNMTWSTVGCSPAPCKAPILISADVLYRPLSVKTASGANSGVEALGAVNEKNLSIEFYQSSVNPSVACSGNIPPNEAALCANPPDPNDKIVCTANGFRCGQVFYDAP